MNLQQLRENRNKALESAKAFLEKHRTQNGTLTDEDDATFSKMEKEIENLSREITRLENLENLENTLNQPVNKPITNKPNNEQSEQKTGRASNEYKEDMLKAMRSGFLQTSNVLQEGVDADGGYLVPEEYDSRLITTLEGENIMRKLATTIQTSGTHKINIANLKPTATWVEEGKTIDFNSVGDNSFQQVLLDAYKLQVSVKITDELLSDNAYNLEDFIINEFGKALARVEENAFLNGDGKGKPTGIFSETEGGNLSATTATIKSDDIISLVYSLKRQYRKNASFIMSDTLIAKVRKLKDSNGQYMWQPALAGGEPDKLMGYDVYTPEYAPENYIAFGDYSYYNIGDRGVRSLKKLIELFATNGMVGFTMSSRVDGKLTLKEAVQLLKIGSSDTTQDTTPDA